MGQISLQVKSQGKEWAVNISKYWNLILHFFVYMFELVYNKWFKHVHNGRMWIKNKLSILMFKVLMGENNCSIGCTI